MTPPPWGRDVPVEPERGLKKVSRRRTEPSGRGRGAPQSGRGGVGETRVRVETTHGTGTLRGNRRTRK